MAIGGTRHAGSRKVYTNGAIIEGDEWANALLKVNYEEMDRQAHRYVEKARWTLHPNYEFGSRGYLQLFNPNNIEWERRFAFFRPCGTKMRCILIDYARIKHRLRRGGFIAICCLKIRELTS